MEACVKRYRLAVMAMAIGSVAALLAVAVDGAGGDHAAAAPKPAVFDNADLRNRDFTGANLDGASFRQAQLQGANFSRARLRGAMFEGAQLDNAKFVEAQLQGAQFATAKMDGVDFTGAQLQGADLSFELRGITFARANLTGVLFGFGTETLLQGADLSGAVLTGADFGRAQMQGASLKSASMRGVDLREANLQGADLGGADLRGANLDRARLQGASLRGAKLRLTLGSPATELADLDGVDLREATALTPKEIRDIVRLFQEPFRDDARERLAVLNPASKSGRKNATKAETWKPADLSAKRLAELLAKVACGWRKDADDAEAQLDAQVDVRVVRGLVRNGRLAAAGDQAAIVAEALRKGRTDPASCPGAAGATDADWAALDALTRAKGPASAAPQPAPPK
jgi:uncharacterized protein YjbI with pentapeptide repeats